MVFLISLLSVGKCNPVDDDTYSPLTELVLVLIHIL